MTEQLISFETAKLAKEKGFPQKYGYAYTVDGKLSAARFNEKTWNEYLDRDFMICAPTQSLLQKWLREKYILIESSPVDDWNTWGFIITLKDISSPFYEIPWNEIEYPTYESALEAGLFEALKLVTDEK